VLQPTRTPVTPVVDLLLGLWWVSWFGIIGGFLCVGVSEVKLELSSGAVSRLSLAFLVAVPLSWICFSVADSKVNERTPKVVNLLTAAGSLLDTGWSLVLCRKCGAG
jgi:hypothetical protein